MPLLDPVTMLTPSGKAGAAQSSKLTDAEAATKPIPILPTSQAQTVRYAHPVLLAAFFYARFNALVQDPVTTMWNSAPAILAIQVAYTTLCLPHVGAPAIKPAKKLRPGEKKKSSTDGVGANIAVTTTVAILLTLISTIPLHVIFVLFGAPFLTHLPNTLLCSLHLSLLALYPLFYSHGVEANEWLEILGARSPFDEGFGGLIGGCFGAWIGAVPIPLDWDREWQKWPVTILIGIYVGYVLGKLVGGSLAYGKRFA